MLQSTLYRLYKIIVLSFHVSWESGSTLKAINTFSVVVPASYERTDGVFVVSFISSGSAVK